MSCPLSSRSSVMIGYHSASARHIHSWLPICPASSSTYRCRRRWRTFTWTRRVCCYICLLIITNNVMHDRRANKNSYLFSLRFCMLPCLAMRDYEENCVRQSIPGMCHYIGRLIVKFATLLADFGMFLYQLVCNDSSLANLP